MKRFVYNEKYAKLLVYMQDKKSNVDDLAKQINAHAGHLRIVLDQWHKEKVINKDRPGWTYSITLTKKGEILASKFAEIIHIVNFYKDSDTVPEDKKVTETKIKVEAEVPKPTMNKGGNQK